MALSADSDRKERQLQSRKLASYVVINGDIVYKGALVCANSSGRATPVRAADLRFLGVATETVTGDSSAEVNVAYGHEVLITATGVTAGQLGLNLVLVDDDKVADSAASGTAATNITVVGELVELESATSAWVHLRGYAPSNS